VHTASPLAPCGRVGCDAVETQVREFQRCSRCKRIAYCSRYCQRLDWTAQLHRRVCLSHDETLAHRMSMAGTPNVVAHHASKTLK
jgi:MYND finger